MTDRIAVAVLGAAGRMGRATCEAIETAPDTDLVAQIGSGDALSQITTAGAQVAVDFTVPHVTEANVHALIDAGVHAVVGTSGWSEEAYVRVREHLAAAPGVGVVVVPNFAIGAVLMMKFAEMAARWFESAEVIEMHHARKVDAPSGTAVHTASGVGKARAAAGMGPLPDATHSSLPGARGALVEGIPVHSVRLPGMVAHEEVLLSNQGELLTIRHDSFALSSFMNGVLLCVRRIGDRPGLTVGMDQLLDLG